VGLEVVSILSFQPIRWTAALALARRGRFDVVAPLAWELEARRVASATNVVAVAV
jgi:hypothetical protein